MYPRRNEYERHLTSIVKSRATCDFTLGTRPSGYLHSIRNRGPLFSKILLHYTLFLYDPIFWLCLLHIFVNRCVTKFAFSIRCRWRRRRAARGRFQSKQARTRSTSSPASPFRIRIVFFAVLTTVCSKSRE